MNIYLLSLTGINMNETVRKLQEANQKTIQSKQKFDQEAFDRKVSVAIYRIHYKKTQKHRNKLFVIWCNKNAQDLRAMYELSGLRCDFNNFCNYVYRNSEH